MKVYVQPYAGKKQGMSIFNTSVLPVFEAANIDFDVTRKCANKRRHCLPLHLYGIALCNTVVSILSMFYPSRNYTNFYS